jgi:hypothetical protein
MPTAQNSALLNRSERDYRKSCRALRLWSGGPGEIAWTGEKPEQGWFRAPRTLPPVLILLSDKKVTNTKIDAGSVYLDLLARHRDSGIVEMATEGEHSYSSGYPGQRGIRSWKERMKLLEDLGFIKSRQLGNQQYKLVLLLHPTVVVQRLYENKKPNDTWWDTYRQRQIETKEPSYEKLMERYKPDKVVPITAAKTKAAKKKTPAA